MNYHVADFVIRIKNASFARRKEVHMPYSKMSKAIAMVLRKEGFLSEIQESTNDGKKELIAILRYVNRKPVVAGVDIISKPSLRVYSSKSSLSQQHNRSVVSVLSTSAGVMSDREAKKKGVGGELLFQIW